MGKTVLSVDDESDARDFVTTVLEENGYTPVTARNGKEAMAILRKQKLDLIILDILMPKQGGIKLYRELKTTGSLRDIPVIIYSGIPRRTLLRAQEALTELGDGAVPDPDAYLEKPVSPERLVTTVRNVLG